MMNLLASVSTVTNIALIVILVIALLFSVMHGIKRGFAVTLVRVGFAAAALVVSVFVTKYMCSTFFGNSIEKLATSDVNSDNIAEYIGYLNHSGALVDFILSAVSALVVFGLVFFFVDKILFIIFAIIKHFMRSDGDSGKKKLSGVSKLLGVIVSMATCFGFYVIYTAPITGTVDMLTENRQAIETAYTALDGMSESGDKEGSPESLSKDVSLSDGSSTTFTFEETFAEITKTNNVFTVKAVNLCGGKILFSFLTNGKVGDQKTSLSNEIQGTCLFAAELPEIINGLQSAGGGEGETVTIDTKPFIDLADAISSSKAVAPKVLATDVMASLDDMIDKMKEQATEDDKTIKLLNALKPLVEHFNSSTPETIGDDIVAFANNAKDLANTLNRVTNINFDSMQDTISSVSEIFEELTPESAQLIVDVVENIDFKDLGIQLTPAQESAVGIVTNSVVDIVELAGSNKEAFDAEVGALSSVMDAFNSGNEATDEQIKTAINDVLETTVISSAITQAVKDENGEIKNDAFGIGETLSEENKAVVTQQLEEYKANNANYDQETIDALAAIFGVKLG